MRSWRYVPGDRPQETAADALVLDCSAGGAHATAGVGDWLDHHRAWVCVDGGDDGHAGLRDLTRPGLAGVCVRRARSASELAALGTVLAGAEEAAGLPVGTIAVVPVLETAAAVLAAAEIARAPRVVGLQLGEEALRAELGVDPGPDERELLWVRSTIVVASAAAGIRPPVGAACPDDSAVRVSTEHLRRLGFGGRVCAAERQVAVVNEIFANA